VTASPTAPASVALSPEERKRGIRTAFEGLAEAAESVGLDSVARDIRGARIPKLDEERFSLVVLGEFNHGKSTFVNALLGQSVLPTGITPTTAILTHVSYGAVPDAAVVLQSGERRAIDPARLADWATVEGLQRAASGPDDPDKPDKVGALDVHHLDLHLPVPLLQDQLTIVDTPGVNDINEQRADITYGYIPRADAALFLLDATQILTSSERQFLEERILRSSRDRLIFVVAKADLLDAAELEEALGFARLHLGRIVTEPLIFPVSSRRELAGDRQGSGFTPLRAQIGLTVGSDRRRLLLEHALADATRLASFVRQSLEMRRRSLELPLPELEERIARAKLRLSTGQQGLDAALATVVAETAALKARVRQDLAAFAAEFRATLPGEIDKVDGHDVRRYLSFFVQDTWKSWLELEGERISAELERLAEAIIEVANENVQTVAAEVSAELGPAQTRVELVVDTFKYDASVFALGAVGTTLFLFVNNLVGGILTLAAPLLAMVFRGRIGREIQEEAKARAPASIDRVAAMLGESLDGAIDTFAARLNEFVAQAGEALSRGIAEVLDAALAEKRRHADSPSETDGSSNETARIQALPARLKAIEEQIAEIRQSIWQL
jgi:GTPase SAR1 family protein